MKRKTIYKKKLEIDWKDIAKLRNYFSEFLNTIKDINMEKINVLVYIISELLENIVKYTSNHLCYLILVMEFRENGNVLHIITENERTSINDSDYKKLTTLVNRINSFSKVEDLFIELTQEYKNNKEGGLSFGFALIKKLTEGNKIVLTEAKYLDPGIRIHVHATC